VARRAQGASISGPQPRLASSATGLIVQGVILAAISAALFWLVWIYGNGLRDPRYLDGWLLAAGMVLQVYFHITLKSGRLSPKAAMSWRQIHIYVGYILVALFISHSNVSLPDTVFEWALWLGFTLITLSGIFGTYLAWSVKTKRKIDERTVFERIPTRRAEIAREVHAIATTADKDSPAIALPALPYNEWIFDLYTNQLHGFLKGQQNFAAHVIGSERTVRRLTDEIENLERYVDKQGKDKLMAIKSLVIEKDRLDFAHTYLWLTKIWLFIHVPMTYSLIVLAVLHVIVVYSFSAGVW
jgi:hypothetical protein